MKLNTTYKQPHSSFKLNGAFYDHLGLLTLAAVFIKASDNYLKSLGVFIEKWVDSNSEISLQTSGSTGTPKTILMSKQSMVNSALATGNYFKPGFAAKHGIGSRVVKDSYIELAHRQASSYGLRLLAGIRAEHIYVGWRGVMVG